MAISVSCPSCLAEFSLKDELGGRKVRCQQCQEVILVPETSAPASAIASLPKSRDYPAAFARDRFLVNQKRIAINEKYYVFDENKQPILFIERPSYFWRQLLAALGFLVVMLACLVGTLVLAVWFGQLSPQTPAAGVVGGLGILATILLSVATAVGLSPKRHITVYADESKSKVLLKVYQDRKLTLIQATYTIEDPNKGIMGRLMKNYMYNIFRKRWYVLDTEGRILFVAKEDSLILSLLRRFLGTMFGLLRTNFVIMTPAADTVLGEFNRKFTLFDRYVLDMTADRAHALDRRMALALAILLDTGERR